MNKLFAARPLAAGIPWAAALLAAGLLAAPGGAQTVKLPEPDRDGWMRLFRGDNASDFYAVPNGGPPPAQANQMALPNATYGIKGDTVQVAGTPHGQFYFKQSFSRYHVRYQYRFPGKPGNCGMLFQVQDNDPTWAGFPRSVESQGDPGQGMGQLWAIGDVWVTVRARSINGNMTYDPNAPETVYGAKDGNSRVVLGQDGWGKPDYQTLSAATGWVTQEALVYGNDSIIHIVEGKVIIKYREPRVSSGGTPNNVTKRLSAGLIAWQAEGAPVWYRHMEVRLLPGDPLYTPVYAAFRDRNTIRPKARRRLVLGADGVLALGAGDGMDGRWFDPVGRALVPIRPTLLPNYR